MSGYIGNTPVPQATQTRQSFVATASQTTFNTSGYTPNYLDVYLNGVRLVDGTDYTATNGSDVVLTVGANASDVLDVLAFKAFQTIGVGRGNTQTTSITGSTTLDYNTYQNFVLTLTGNVTLANPTTEAIGQSGFMVFIQDGTGSRTVSLGTDYETVNGLGISLSTTASARDVVPYIVSATGSIILGEPQKNFS